MPAVNNNDKNKDIECIMTKSEQDFVLINQKYLVSICVLSNKCFSNFPIVNISEMAKMHSMITKVA